MPAKKRKSRARRSSPAAWPRLPQLEQRHLDLIGLGLVAAAIFFAFLIYLEWEGGRAGGWAVDGLRHLIGAVHYGVPIALMTAGAILVMRPMLPSVRPFRSGGLCLFLGLVLGLAAGTFGLGPGGEAVQLGRRVGAPPRRRGGRGHVLGDLDGAGRRRRAHRRPVLLRRGRAAADGRVNRGRGEGDERLCEHHHAGRARRPCSGAARPTT